MEDEKLVDIDGTELLMSDIVTLVNDEGTHLPIKSGDEFTLTGRFDDNIIQVLSTRTKEYYGLFADRFRKL